jgi:hypothetical protein
LILLSEVVETLAFGNPAAAAHVCERERERERESVEISLTCMNLLGYWYIV